MLIVNAESSPVPTCNSKQEPVVAIDDKVSPSSIIVHDSPSISASTPDSNSSMFSSVGVSVGMITSLIVESAYSPPTFCIDHVCVASFIANTPAHSNEPDPWS